MSLRHRLQHCVIQLVRRCDLSEFSSKTLPSLPLRRAELASNKALAIKAVLVAQL